MNEMAEAEPVLVRLKPIPIRLRIVHLAALIRHEREGSQRAVELTALLCVQSAALAASLDGGRGGRKGGDRKE
jgi:hypothetical protein